MKKIIENLKKKTATKEVQNGGTGETHAPVKKPGVVTAALKRLIEASNALHTQWGGASNDEKGVLWENLQTATKEAEAVISK